VFLRPIEADAETAKCVVKATCCLHNYVLSNNIFAAVTETEAHVAPFLAFSNKSSNNPRSNKAAFEVRKTFSCLL
jgi:hypothetical protein